MAYERFFAVHVELASEAAADLWRDHPDMVLAQAEDLGKAGAKQVRNLRRRPYRQIPLAGIPLCDDPPRLHRNRGEALVDDSEAHHFFRVAHRLVHSGRWYCHVEGDIGSELLVQYWCAFGDRL